MIYIVFKDYEFSEQLFETIIALNNLKKLCFQVHKNSDMVDYSELTGIELLFVEADCLEDLEKAEQYKQQHQKTQIIIYTDCKKLVEKGYHFDFFRVLFKENLLEELVELQNSYLKKVRETILELHVNHEMVRVKMKEIDYILSKANYVYIYFNGKEMKIRSPFSNFFDKFNNNPDFLLIDRAVYLNLKSIKSINYKEQYVTLLNEKVLDCSRSGVQNLKKHFNRFK